MELFHVRPLPLCSSTAFDNQITDDEETLIVANMGSGELFAVNPETGDSALIDLGGVLLHGDGMVNLEKWQYFSISREEDAILTCGWYMRIQYAVGGK